MWRIWLLTSCCNLWLCKTGVGHESCLVSAITLTTNWITMRFQWDLASSWILLYWVKEHLIELCQFLPTYAGFVGFGEHVKFVSVIQEVISLLITHPPGAISMWLSSWAYSRQVTTSTFLSPLSPSQLNPAGEQSLLVPGTLGLGHIGTICTWGGAQWVNHVREAWLEVFKLHWILQLHPSN